MGAVKHWRSNSIPTSPALDRMYFVPVGGSYVQYVINNAGVPIPPAVMSHAHAVSDITGLQTSLDGKLPLTGGILTGGLEGTGATFSGKVRGKSSYVLPASGSNVAYTSGSFEAFVSSADRAAGARPGIGFHAEGGWGAYVYLNGEAELRMRGLGGTDVGFWHTGNLRSDTQNDARYALAASVAGYVRKDTADTITAAHTFTSQTLKLPNHYFHYNTDYPSDIYVHYYPAPGHVGPTIAHLRVATASGIARELTLNGSGSMTWGGAEIATQNWVQTNYGGTVTQIGLVVPTGFDVLSAPVTSTGNLQFGFSAGYSLVSPTDRAAWNASGTGYVNNTPVSADWNTVNSDAKAKFNTSATNSANGNNMHGLFIPHASLSNFGSAIMFRAGLGYFRSLESGTWGAWQEFANKAWTQSYVTSLGYTSNVGTVTQVGLVAPTGFDVLSSPVTGSGNLQFGLSAGYSLVSGSDRSTWNSKLNNYSTTGLDWSTINSDGVVKFNTSSTNSPAGDLIVHGMYIPHNNFGNYGTSLTFRAGIGYFQSIENGNLSGWKTIADRDFVTSRGYITGINSGMVTTALGYTPLSGVTYSHVVNALGYDPLRNDRTARINGWTQNLRDNPEWNVGTVTQVGLAVPTGFDVLSSPVTGSGNLQFGFSGGYSLVSSSDRNNWNAGGSKWTSSGSDIYRPSGTVSIGRTSAIGTAQLSVQGDIYTNSQVYAVDFIATNSGAASLFYNVLIGGGSMPSGSMFSANSTTHGSSPFPKMTYLERKAINGGNPADWIFVIQTDTGGSGPTFAAAGLYMSTGGNWVRVTNGTIAL